MLKENKAVVFHTLTNSTTLLILCARNHLVSGYNYVFQSRVKALCGYGKQSVGFGYYPRNGKFCLGSWVAPCKALEALDFLAYEQAHIWVTHARPAKLRQRAAKTCHASGEATRKWGQVSLQRSLYFFHFHPGNHRNTINQLNYTGSSIFDSAMTAARWTIFSITRSAEKNPISYADSLSSRKIMSSKHTHLIPSDLVSVI